MFQKRFLNAPTSTSLKILVTSDIHLALEKINQLGDWLTLHNKENVDFIICCGDLTNMDPADQGVQELVSACEGEMSSVLARLENVCAKVVYLPGNHDAKTALEIGEPRPRITTHSVNLHHRCLRVAPDLVLVGLGGSVPAFQSEEQVWVGYPFTDEKQVSAALTTLLKENIATQGSTADEITDEDTIILVTHCGPYDSSTTVDQVDLDAQPIQSGSHAIKSFLLDPTLRKKILLNIHGHTHHSLGLTRLGKTFVMNPGSLRTGHFALLSLNRLYEHKWRIVGTEFLRV